MKRLILVSIASLLLSSTYASAEWVKPTRSACSSNGGILTEGGCEVNWQSAKDICLASGARLPTISELEEVITSCDNDLDYKSCYERKGFINGNFYWSSIEHNNDFSFGWRVGFSGSGDFWYDKLDRLCAVCVRGQ